MYYPYPRKWWREKRIMIYDSHCNQVEKNNPIYFFKICLAGLNIEVECSNGRYYTHCIPYLSHFKQADIISHADTNDILSRYSYILTGDPTAISHEETIELGAVEAEIIYENIALQAIDYKTFLMHGAVVAKDGFSYMFSGPCGIGKSTRVKLWIDEYPDSIIINGDKPLIKVTNNEIIACGTPWCGKEGWNTNIMLPLKAIFFLERAGKNEEDSIEEIGFNKAFPLLLQQTYRPNNRDAMKKTIQLLKALEGKVKCYRFRSHPTTESVSLAYKTAHIS